MKRAFAVFHRIVVTSGFMLGGGEGKTFPHITDPHVLSFTLRLTTVKVFAVPRAAVNPARGVLFCCVTGSFTCVQFHDHMSEFMGQQYIL